jgi:hypothetical protein
MKTKILVAVGIAAAACVVGVIAVAAGVTAETAPAASAPTSVDQVPATIPAEGVSIDPVANIVLTPADASSSDATIVDSETAMSRAPSILATGEPIGRQAVLAYATVGATVPSVADLAAGEQWRTIANRLVWVVTLTYPKPVDTRIGMAYSETPEPTPAAAMQSHFNALMDARTGELLWGFFTN